MSTAELVRDVEVDVEPDQIAEPYPTDYSAGRAESDLRRIAEARQEIEEIKSHAQEQRNQTDAWEAREIERLENSIRWQINNVNIYASRSEKKTVRLINGTIKRIAPRLSIEITDESKIPEKYIRRTEKISPDKKAILDHVKETGEIIDGADLVEGEESWKITTN